MNKHLRRKIFFGGGALLLITVLVCTCMALFSAAETPFTLYASDLQDIITNKNPGWGEVKFDCDLSGDLIHLRNDGKRLEFQKGICAHASSTIDFNVDGLGMTEFSAYVGINDGAGNAAYAKYAYASFQVKIDGKETKVTVDGEEKDKAGPYTIEEKAHLLKVKIPDDAKTVTLVTNEETLNPDAEKSTTHLDNNASDHTVWADAKFTFSAKGAKALKSVQAESSSIYISEKQPATIKATGLALDGSEISDDDLDVTYKSSNDSVATVNDGTITAGDEEGDATITITAEKDSKKAETKITVHNISEDSTTQFPVTSPGGQISILLSLKDGKVVYSVAKGSTTVIAESGIGVTGSNFNLSNLTYQDKAEVETVDNTYTNYSGSYAKGRDHYNERKVTFKSDKITFPVTVRAYDDGFAFRWGLEGQDSFTITKETTEFTPAEKNSTLYAMEVGGPKAHYNGETGFPKKTFSATKEKYFGLPALLQNGDLYTLLTEADIWGGEKLYCGNMLISDGSKFTTTPGVVAEDSTTVKGPFTSPWRCGVVGDLETVVESDLIDNLNPRTTENYDWVKPGVTSWTWLSEGRSGQNNPKIIKDYIDLAAEMNWSYVLLDDGWQPGDYTKGYSGYYEWFDDVMDYAKKKGVGILVWARWQDLDTDAKLKQIDDWAKKGIKGVKADFFDSENQTMLQVIKNIYEKCKENHLMLNIHGSNKPTGERMSYPFVISREYVKGQEYGGVYSSDTTVWAYTRGVVGPTDITPKLTATGDLTSAQQIALNVVFEGGFPCMADDSEVYRSSNIKSFFRSLPAKWDAMEFLDGGVGTYTVLARKSGSEWWVGAVNSQSEREVEVKLSEFLGDGSYYAVTYYDGDNKNEILTKTEKVTKTDTLKVKMAKGGGFVIRIFPEKELTPVRSIYSTDEFIQVQEGYTASSHFDIFPANAQLSDLRYESADEKVATVSAGGVVTGVKPGVTTVTAKDHFDKVLGRVEVRVFRPTGRILNDKLEIVQRNFDSEITYPTDDSVTLPITTGDINRDVQNLILLKKAGNEDFTATVKVTGGLGSDFESIGLIAYNGKGKMVVMERRNHSSLGSASNGKVFTLSTYKDNYDEKVANDTNSTADVWLKLSKTGSTFTGSYSYNGKDWTEIKEKITSNDVNTTGMRVGIVAMSGSYSSSRKATFSDFTVGNEKIPFIVNKDTRELCKLYEDSISVLKGGSFTMPETVKGYISDGTFADIPVTWDTSKVNKDKVDNYTVTGTVKKGSTYAGKGISTVTWTVKVKNPSPYDLDGDQLLTIQDVTLMLSHLAGDDSAKLTQTGDFTKDTKVTVKDLSRLLQYLALE